MLNLPCPLLERFSEHISGRGSPCGSSTFCMEKKKKLQKKANKKYKFLAIAKVEYERQKSPLPQFFRQMLLPLYAIITKSYELLLAKHVDTE